MTSTAAETMGARIRAALKEVGFSISEAGIALGVTRHTVSRWLGGDECPEHELRRVAALTGKTCPWLRYGLIETETRAVEQLAATRYEAGYTTGFADAIAQMKQYVAESFPATPDAQSRIRT